MEIRKQHLFIGKVSYVEIHSFYFFTLSEMEYELFPITDADESKVRKDFFIMKKEKKNFGLIEEDKVPVSSEGFFEVRNNLEYTQLYYYLLSFLSRNYKLHFIVKAFKSKQNKVGFLLHKIELKEKTNNKRDIANAIDERNRRLTPANLNIDCFKFSEDSFNLNSAELYRKNEVQFVDLEKMGDIRKFVLHFSRLKNQAEWIGVQEHLGMFTPKYNNENVFSSRRTNKWHKKNFSSAPEGLAGLFSSTGFSLPSEFSDLKISSQQKASVFDAYIFSSQKEKYMLGVGGALQVIGKGIKQYSWIKHTLNRFKGNVLWLGDILDVEIKAMFSCINIKSRKYDFEGLYTYFNSNKTDSDACNFVFKYIFADYFNAKDIEGTFDEQLGTLVQDLNRNDIRLSFSEKIESSLEDPTLISMSDDEVFCLCTMFQEIFHLPSLDAISDEGNTSEFLREQLSGQGSFSNLFYLVLALLNAKREGKSMDLIVVQDKSVIRKLFSATSLFWKINSIFKETRILFLMHESQPVELPKLILCDEYIGKKNRINGIFVLPGNDYFPVTINNTEASFSETPVLLEVPIKLEFQAFQNYPVRLKTHRSSIVDKVKVYSSQFEKYYYEKLLNISQQEVKIVNNSEFITELSQRLLFIEVLQSISSSKEELSDLDYFKYPEYLETIAELKRQGLLVEYKIGITESMLNYYVTKEASPFYFYLKGIAYYFIKGLKQTETELETTLLNITSQRATGASEAGFHRDVINFFVKVFYLVYKFLNNGLEPPYHLLALVSVWDWNIRFSDPYSMSSKVTTGEYIAYFMDAEAKLNRDSVAKKVVEYPAFPIEKPLAKVPSLMSKNFDRNEKKFTHGSDILSQSGSDTFVKEKKAGKPVSGGLEKHSSAEFSEDHSNELISIKDDFELSKNTDEVEVSRLQETGIKSARLPNFSRKASRVKSEEVSLVNTEIVDRPTSRKSNFALTTTGLSEGHLKEVLEFQNIEKKGNDKQVVEEPLEEQKDYYSRDYYLKFIVKKPEKAKEPNFYNLLPYVKVRGVSDLDLSTKLMSSIKEISLFRFLSGKLRKKVYLATPNLPLFEFSSFSRVFNVKAIYQLSEEHIKLLEKLDVAKKGFNYNFALAQLDNYGKYLLLAQKFILPQRHIPARSIRLLHRSVREEIRKKVSSSPDLIQAVLNLFEPILEAWSLYQKTARIVDKRKENGFCIQEKVKRLKAMETSKPEFILAFINNLILEFQEYYGNIFAKKCKPNFATEDLLFNKTFLSSNSFYRLSKFHITDLYQCLDEGPLQSGKEFLLKILPNLVICKW